MPKAKIIIPFSKFHPATGGGPINSLLGHTKELVRSGYDVKIITTNNNIKESVQVLNNKWIEKEFGKIIYLSGFFKVIKHIRLVYREAKRSDIIHFNSVFSPYCFLPYLTLKFFNLKIKTVWSVRGELNENALNFKSWKKKPVFFVLKKIMKRDSIIYHATSEKEKSEIQYVMGNQNIVLIPNLFYLNEKNEIKQENQLLFIGRIHPIKSIENIIEAIHLSKWFREKNFKLIIAGEYEKRYTNYFNNLKSLINQYELSDLVEFAGSIQGEAKQKLYAQTYFTLLVSKTENFGNVVLESLAQGTPVIASKGTPWRDLNKNKAGFHIDNDPEIIAQTIDSILCMSQNSYTEYRTNAFRFSKKFDIKTKFGEWNKVYKQ
ncbi:glycosyltransferase family 4 protein [Aureibaculum algae]|uniref:Glycosyltransferase family 4 protein n=1 Tax=Aureibaculum algae TaxID=2584122 RepID=A0A5B7TVZ5_9FLAO|nr:glycosyltransferase family 4 protein [Aureibaculum algae]QCX38822.1 glycosyltransferase family 4 protein [Aureibaculum algae]